MNKRRSIVPQARSRGYSLIEMAVVLLIIGLVGALFWQLLPRLQSASNPEPAEIVQLRAAEDALTGFALAHSRLPCPDTNGDGLEDCAGTAQVGQLPQRTLGQVLPYRLRYGVNRLAADLTQLNNLYTPLIPGTPTGPVLNGLDLCVALRTAQASAATGVSVGSKGAATAFALASRGAADADGNGDLFDGLNAGTGFAAPNTPITAAYDDYTVAMGYGELAQRLGCLHRLAVVNGAARSAVAARDLHDMAVFYKRFRHFANLGTRAVDITMADFSLTLAIVDMAVAGAQLALAIAAAAESAGAAAADVVLAGVAVADAGANLALAIIGVQDAHDSKTTAEDQDAAATVTQAEYKARMDKAIERAHAEDALGLIK